MPGLFPDEDDEEAKWGALLGMPPLQAPALSDPAMQPQALPAQSVTQEMPDHWAALAGVGAPPELQAPDKTGLILAMFADMMLNKGRSMGPLIGAAAQQPDTELANYKLRMQHAKDLASMQDDQVDPRVLAARERALDLQSRGLDLEQGRLDAMQQRAGASGLTPEQQLAREKWEHEKATGGQLTPYQREMLDLRREQAQAMSATREDSAEAKQLAQQAQAEQRSATNSGKYWNDTEYYRAGAQAMQRLEGVLGKYKEGDDLPAVGMLDSRVPKWALGEDGLAISSGMDWMNNAIQRAESGAAAPIPEVLGYKIRTGSAPGATEAQFREGVAAAQEYLRGQLSSRASGMEPEARDVLKRQGLESWVFPPAPAANSDEDEWEDIQ